jgi:hypothetical protein
MLVGTKKAGAYYACLFLIEAGKSTCFDSVARALAGASTAIHAGLFIDCVRGALFDCFNRTGIHAQTASYAGISDFVSHFISLVFVISIKVKLSLVLLHFVPLYEIIRPMSVRFSQKSSIGIAAT